MDTCHGNYRGSRSREAARRHAKLLQGSACDSGKARGCVGMACRIILQRSKVERGSVFFTMTGFSYTYVANYKGECCVLRVCVCVSIILSFVIKYFCFFAEHGWLRSVSWMLVNMVLNAISGALEKFATAVIQERVKRLFVERFTRENQR